MNFLDVLILSIIEGVTEFLPVSSTAHLQIAEKLLGIPPSDFTKSFTLIIQVGALFGTALYLFQKRSLFEWNLKKIILACLPTLAVGFVLYKLIKDYFFGNFWLIAIALVAGGIVMMIAEQHIDKRTTGLHGTVTYRKSIMLGLAQALAVIPGVSRSGAVLVAGYFFNIEKKHLAQFTFLIGFPVALAASAYDVFKTGFAASGGEILMTVVGVVLAGLFSYVASGWFLNLITRFSLRIFAWYRIFLGILIMLALTFF